MRPFEARAYAVESRIRDDGSGTSSHGSAEVAVGGEILRGEASGGGPLDALERALRSALLPAYPALARVLTSDFRAQVAQGRDRAHGIVRVRFTAPSRDGRRGRPSAAPTTSCTRPGSRSPTASSTRSRRGPASTRASTSSASSRPSRWPSSRPLLVDEVDGESLRAIAEIDWHATTLDLADGIDRELAARATAQGAALAYSFGNFCAIAAHPDRHAVVRVNLLKGRPENQVGSVTTTRDRVDALFDWSQLPEASRARRCSR